jgi:methionyl-tRNA formyltransferase
VFGKGVGLMDDIRIALFGDQVGIPQLLEVIPKEACACLVVSAIRPESHGPVRKLAQNLSIPFVIQPRKKDREYSLFVEEMTRLDPTMILCNSYSLLIRDEVRQLVGPHALNIHGALLPKNRGCNPIQWAIIKREQEFGVTMHRMDGSFDTGDIVAQRTFPIYEEDTWVDVRNRLNKETELLLKESAPLLLKGEYSCLRQDKLSATYNERLTPDTPRIDFVTMNDRDIYNLIRAQVAPLKGAYIDTEKGRIHFSERLNMDDVQQLRSQYARPLCHSPA